MSVESSPRIEPLLPDLSIVGQDEERNLRLPGKGQDPVKEERQQLALRYVHEHGSITNKEYRAITGASENTALRDLDDLIERGSLRGLGKRRARHYKLP
jgi:predicted HTH transcriptional regulator